ncbi:MerR family transcriptional regulator [Massilia sp. PAMC28688]|nr:MerR family transcriptional regulator [Massilia sp. PAMC28688]
MKISEVKDVAGPSYRSGVAARLAGLSVETLRVWERRYGVCDTERSEHGQRLYSAPQVRRLGMLKQLVDNGHPIGMLAGLSSEQLEAMALGAGAAQTMQSGPIRLAVVGEGLARRIAAAGRDGLDLYVQRSCPGLEQVPRQLAGVLSDVLLIEMSEPDDQALPLLVAARDSVGVQAVVVLYRFCSSATIRSMRAQGFLVARVPAEPGELVLLCRAALAGNKLALPERPVQQVAPPRYDEAELATLTTARNGVECECPRHLAEILMMVGSFERYSAQCAARNDDDASLHRELGHAAGLARTMLEGAMARLVQAENLPVRAAADERD